MRVITAATERPTRHQRRPSFPIIGKLKPYGLYPLWVHPVLPGETLDRMTAKLRVISKPVKHPLAGAWFETWLCYVKFTDIDRNLGEMFVSDSFSTAGYTATADRIRHFTKTGQIDWVKMCVDRIHESYFLNAEETPRLIDTVPMVKLSNTSWYQNLMFQPAEVDETKLPSAGADTQLTGFQMMQLMSMSELTYENYLKQFGVQAIRAETGKPEILRYTRSWTQPTNTVDPATGLPSSAWAWSEDLNMDKAKRFDEPGFIVHLGAVRPKMFQGGIKYSMVGNLWGFSDWFPAYNITDPMAGVRQILGTDEVFADAIDGNPATPVELLYDHRDLLNHGEQFVNANDHPYAVPTANGMSLAAGASDEDVRGEYPLTSDVDALFTSSLDQNGFCYYEGMAMPVINGHVRDTTMIR